MKGNVLKKVKIAYLMVSLAGLCTVVSGAFYGGKLVYQHGIGLHPRTFKVEPRPEINNQKELQSKDNLFYPAPDSIP